tara:strand:- start:389 stop:712 length:324 start_codon:yes stop_codon:yes gene_type:complete
MKIGKYEFDSLEQANTKIKGLGTTTDENGNEVPSHNHTVVRLGNIVLEKPEYDEEGNVTKEAVYSLKYSVDVSWDGEEAEEFNSFKIDIIGEGVHGFFGISYQENKA